MAFSNLADRLFLNADVDIRRCFIYARVARGVVKLLHSAEGTDISICSFPVSAACGRKKYHEQNGDYRERSHKLICNLETNLRKFPSLQLTERAIWRLVHRSVHVVGLLDDRLYDNFAFNIYAVHDGCIPFVHAASHVLVMSVA